MGRLRAALCRFARGRMPLVTSPHSTCSHSREGLRLAPSWQDFMQDLWKWNGAELQPSGGMAVAENIEDVLMKRLRAVEHEQIDLLQQVVDVMRHAHTGNQAMFVESLAQIVGTAYVMAQELGISPERLEREVVLVLESMPLDPESDRHHAAQSVIQYLKARW